jgi:hypothetical protein
VGTKELLEDCANEKLSDARTVRCWLRQLLKLGSEGVTTDATGALLPLMEMVRHWLRQLPSGSMVGTGT